VYLALCHQRLQDQGTRRCPQNERMMFDFPRHVIAQVRSYSNLTVSHPFIYLFHLFAIILSNQCKK